MFSQLVLFRGCEEFRLFECLIPFAVNIIFIMYVTAGFKSWSAEELNVLLPNYKLRTKILIYLLVYLLSYLFINLFIYLFIDLLTDWLKELKGILEGKLLVHKAKATCNFITFLKIHGALKWNSLL